MEIPIDLSNLPRREWVSMSKRITKGKASAATDQFRIEVRKEDLPRIKAARFLIDEISIQKVQP
ncbi:MAG: hypothetical protein AAF206_24715 [Bacteroidota bacterium]